MIEISVVIGTLNQRAVLEEVLTSFTRQTYPMDFFEVVVVDSSSSDGTDLYCERTTFPFTLRYFRVENRGKVPARNLGIERATGKFLLLTDGDVLAHPRLLEEHLIALRRFPGASIVGRQMIVPSLDDLENNGALCFRRNKRRWQRLNWTQYVTGNASISREALIAAGMFDERFNEYGYEDYELAYRLVQRGMPLLYHPDAVNYHFHPVTFEDDCVRKRGAGRAAVRFADKFHSPALNLRLGVHSLNRMLYGVAPVDGWLMHYIRSVASRPSRWQHAARQFMLELYYQQGIRDELTQRG